MYFRERKQLKNRDQIKHGKIENCFGTLENEIETNKNKEGYDKLINQIKYMKGVKLGIDFPAINSMCTAYLVQEEKFYLETLKVTFEKAWLECNQGERLMNEYIYCCQKRKSFTSEFVLLCSRQFRLSCVHSFY